MLQAYNDGALPARLRQWRRRFRRQRRNQRNGVAARSAASNHAHAVVQWGLLAACLISYACSTVPAGKLDGLYEQALSELRSDAFEHAEANALQGISLAAKRGDAWRQWRFRLL